MFYAALLAFALAHPAVSGFIVSEISTVLVTTKANSTTETNTATTTAAASVPATRRSFPGGRMWSHKPIIRPHTIMSEPPPGKDLQGRLHSYADTVVYLRKRLQPRLRRLKLRGSSSIILSTATTSGSNSDSSNISISSDHHSQLPPPDHFIVPWHVQQKLLSRQKIMREEAMVHAGDTNPHVFDASVGMFG